MSGLVLLLSVIFYVLLVAVVVISVKRFVDFVKRDKPE